MFSQRQNLVIIWLMLYNIRMPNILSFKSPDMVNLQGWLHKAPKEFNRAVTNITNTIAFAGRQGAIKNIEKNTHTRNKSFVKRSMRVDKARHGKNLNQIVAVMGSVDISRQGRSTGFEELETGIASRNKRVPTLASRGGNESRQVAGPVRMNKLTTMYRHRMVRGKGLRTKRARVAAMLRVVKSGAIGRQPFIIPRGIKSGAMSNLPPGVWRLGNGKRLQLVNPFQNNIRKRTKAIKWMSRSSNEVTKDSNLKAVWDKEVDRVVKRRK